MPLTPLDASLLEDAWDFADPAASETTLRGLRAEHTDNPLATAELDTQIARERDGPPDPYVDKELDLLPPIPPGDTQ